MAAGTGKNQALTGEQRPVYAEGRPNLRVVRPQAGQIIRNLALTPLTSEQAGEPKPEQSLSNKALTSEQEKRGVLVSGATLTSERGSGSPVSKEEMEAEWLKRLLPAPIKGKTGWWDVEARGKGFGLKFRWRSHGVKTLTFARVSRATFRKLQKLNSMAVEIGGKVYDKAEWYLSDWIAGQLDDFSRGRDRERRAKAGEAATRLGLAASDD